MKYNEFANIVKKIDGIYLSSVNAPYSNKIIDDCISATWTVGGESGGSCWGGEFHPVSAEPEPEFNQLDLIFEQFCPDISFLKYKKLISKIPFDTFDKTETEYYGNYYEYRTKYIKLIDVYNCLIEEKLI